jgi:hypothetical protein
MVTVGGAYLFDLTLVFFSVLFSQARTMRFSVVFSWLIFFVLNVMVSLVKKPDYPILNHLTIGFGESSASLMAYIGWSVVVGMVALAAVSSVLCYIRLSFDMSSLPLTGLVAWAVWNTFCFGVDLYLFNLRASDTVIIAAVTVLLSGLSTATFCSYADSCLDQSCSIAGASSWCSEPCLFVAYCL